MKSASSPLLKEEVALTEKKSSETSLLDVKKFYSKFSFAFLVHILGYGLQLIMHGSLPFFMSMTDYGEFVICLAWALLLTKLSMLGVESVLTRFVAIYRKKEKDHLASYLVNWSQRVCLVSSAIVMCIAGLVGLVLLRFSVVSNASVFWLTGGSVVASTLLNLQGAKLRGMNRPVTSQIGANCLRPFFVICSVVGMYYWLGESLHAIEVLSIYIVSTFASLSLMSLFRLNKVSSEKLSELRKRRHEKLWKMTAVPLLVSSIATLLLRQSDIIMLGAISTSDQVAVYNIASRIAALCIFATPVINTIVGNHYASLYSSKKIKELQLLVTRSSRISLLAITVVAAGIFLGGETLLSLFGEGYVQSQNVLNTLMIGWICVAVTGQIGLLLTMTGQEYRQVILVVTGCIINLSLNASLIPYYGAVGASLATIISMFVTNLGLVKVAQWQLGVSVSPFYGLLRSKSPGEANHSVAIVARDVAA